MRKWNHCWVVQDVDTGTVLEWFKTEKEAIECLERFEAEDKADGYYIPDFYEVVYRED